MSNTLVSLESVDLLHISGPDTDRFLQGQLTCNIDHLTSDHALPGAYCNVKGRVIADFLAIRTGDDVLLVLHAGMAEILRLALQKYAVFFKTNMSIVTHEWQSVGWLLGNTGTDAGSPPWLQAYEKFTCTRWPGGVSVTLPGPSPRLMLLIQADTADEHLTELAAHGDAGGHIEWELAEIAAGLAHIVPALSEQYTPQVLNYDLNGTVDFRKGCYTGQEVVARMHYRGTAKKRMYRASTQGNESVSLDSQDKLMIVDANGKQCGEIISAVRRPGGSTDLLVILPCTLADSAMESAATVFLTEPSKDGTTPAPAPLLIQALQY